MKCQEKRALVRKIMLLNTTNNAMPAPKTSIFHSMCNARTRLLRDKIMPNCLYFTELCPQASTDMCGVQNYAGIYKDIMSSFTMKTLFKDLSFFKASFSHLIQQHYHPLKKYKRKRVNSPRRYQITIKRFCSLNISIQMQTMYIFAH